MCVSFISAQTTNSSNPSTASDSKRSEKAGEMAFKLQDIFQRATKPNRERLDSPEDKGMFVSHLPAYPSPNEHLCKQLSVLISSNDTIMDEGGEYSRANLNSHVNMVVFGKHCVIFNKSGI